MRHALGLGLRARTSDLWFLFVAGRTRGPDESRQNLAVCCFLPFISVLRSSVEFWRGGDGIVLSSGFAVLILASIL